MTDYTSDPRWKSDPKVQAARNKAYCVATGNIDALNALCAAVAAAVAAVPAETPEAPDAWLMVKKLRGGEVHRHIFDGPMDPREVHDNGGEYIPLFPRPASSTVTRAQVSAEDRETLLEAAAFLQATQGNPYAHEHAKKLADLAALFPPGAPAMQEKK